MITRSKRQIELGSGQTTTTSSNAQLPPWQPVTSHEHESSDEEVYFTPPDICASTSSESGLSSPPPPPPPPARRRGRPPSARLGPVGHRVPRPASATDGVVRRMRWSHTMNENCMRAYYRATEGETFMTAYRDRMLPLFQALEPTVSVSAQRLSDQVRAIHRCKLLDDSTLDRLRSEALSIRSTSDSRRDPPAPPPPQAPTPVLSAVTPRVGLVAEEDDFANNSVKLEFSRNSIVQQESELRELKSELRNVQQTLENIENMLTRAKSHAKEKLIEAKRSSGNKLPQDPDFPYKDQFEELPSDVNSLQEHCYELQTRIDCMEEGDEQVIKEYEEREKQINKLKAEVSNSSDANKRLEKKMEALRKKWLPPLENLLRNINKSFGDMFAKLGCAGEIKLDKGGSDDDYDKYGISILVSFRESEQLQQLTRHAQSGGERALSTALYLMALQSLTTVPFRCVDEINQGMDPINERKMFQLLVKVTTECDNAQYFLLTPKLLTNLEYNDKIMVHTIMNGRSIMNYRKWKISKFIENAHQYRINNE